MLNPFLMHALGRPTTPYSMTLMSWLREIAGILALTPVLLVHFSERLGRWVGAASYEPQTTRPTAFELAGLAIQALLWSAALVAAVHFREQYNLNVSYLAFLPPLALTLRHGMRLSTISLAVNTIIATTLGWRSSGALFCRSGT